VTADGTRPRLPRRKGARITYPHSTNGQECAGGSCGASGAESNPNVCANACLGQSDCSSTFQCANVEDYNLCVPLGNTYTCTQ
jgi:hypothetical protein